MCQPLIALEGERGVRNTLGVYECVSESECGVSYDDIRVSLFFGKRDIKQSFPYLIPIHQQKIQS